MLKEELEKMLGMAPRDNYVTQKPSSITYMKEGKVVPAPAEIKKPVSAKPSSSPAMDPNILGNQLSKMLAPNAPVRSNYVEALPSDIVPEKKTSPEKLEMIKKQFKIAASPQVSAPAAQAPVAPQQSAPTQQIPETIPAPEEPAKRTPSSISDTIDGMKEKVGWGDILPALAPLLTGALMGGGTGVASGVAGDYLLGNVAEREKRNKSLEDKLLEIEKAKAKASSKTDTLNKRFQSRPIWDPELGRSVYANYDTVTGEMYHLDGTPIKNKGVEVGFAVTPEEANRRAAMAYEYKKRGIDYTPRINPETGFPERAGGQAVFKQTLSLNPTQRKALEDQATKFTGSPAFKESRTALAASKNVYGLLSLAKVNNTAGNAARLTLLKMAGNVGATSDKDLALMKADSSIRASAQRTYERLMNGKDLLPEDIKQLKQVANLYYKNSYRAMNLAMEDIDKQYASEYNAPMGTLRARIQPYSIESKPQAKPDTIQRTGKDGKVWTYKLNKKTGKYE